MILLNHNLAQPHHLDYYTARILAILAATHRALAPVFQFLAAWFRMLFHYPIVALQTLYCFVEAMSVKTHFIIVECLFLSFVFSFFALVFIFAIANDRHKAKAEKMLNEEIRFREDQHNRQVADKENQRLRHIADKEACHLRQVQEIETREDLMIGIVSDKFKDDQIHATVLKRLSELVTLQEVDQAIERHMKVTSGSTEPPPGPYPAVSDTMTAFSQDIGVHMQLQINKAVSRGYEQLKTSTPLSFSRIQSQETTSTPPTSQKSPLSVSSVSSVEPTPIFPSKNALSFSSVVAQDTAPVVAAKPVLSLSSVSSQETKPLDVSRPKLPIDTIVSQSTLPEQAQLPKLSMSKIEAVSISPLEVAPAPLVLSNIKTVLKQAPVPCQATADAAEAKEVVAQLLAVIDGLKTGLGNLEGLQIQCITFDMDGLKHGEAASLLKEFKRRINMLFFGYAQNEDAARSELHLATSENDGLNSGIDGLKSENVEKEEVALSELRIATSEIDGQKSMIDGQKSEVDGLKSAIVELKSEIGGQKSEIDEKKSEIGGLKSEIDDQKSDADGLKSEILELKSELGIYAGISATLQCDYDEDLERFEQQLAGQAEQEFEADEVTTPVMTGLAASAAPFAPVLSPPEISVPTQAHVAAVIEEPIKALSPPATVEKKIATPPPTGLLTSSFAPELSLKSPNFPAPVQTPTKVNANVSTPTKIEAKIFAPSIVEHKVASSSGTGLSASAHASGVSSKPMSVPDPVQTQTATVVKAATPTRSTPKIEVTKTVENGTHCNVCDVMVTISMEKHAEDRHGYCVICNQMVPGDWTNNRFSYDKHKELCRTTFKPKPEVKTPATPKPTAATSKTPARTPKSPATPATSETTKTFVCRHCHEDVIAPVINTREGHQIGDFSKHNITCRSERTYIKFHCVNCGMGVTNTDQFHAEHRATCQKETSKTGNFRAFDMKIGLRIGESTEGLPPMTPRAMMGRTDGGRVTKAPAKVRGPMPGSQHSTPVKGSTTKKPRAEREASVPRGRGGASSSPAQPQWEGKVIKY